jgi:hypothetical protein
MYAPGIAEAEIERAFDSRQGSEDCPDDFHNRKLLPRQYDGGGSGIRRWHVWMSHNTCIRLIKVHKTQTEKASE